MFTHSPLKVRKIKDKAERKWSDYAENGMPIFPSY